MTSATRQSNVGNTSFFDFSGSIMRKRERERALESLHTHHRTDPHAHTHNRVTTDVAGLLCGSTLRYGSENAKSENSIYGFV